MKFIFINYVKIIFPLTGDIELDFFISIRSASSTIIFTSTIFKGFNTMSISTQMLLKIRIFFRTIPTNPKFFKRHGELTFFFSMSLITNIHCFITKKLLLILRFIHGFGIFHPINDGLFSCKYNISVISYKSIEFFNKF